LGASRAPLELLQLGGETFFGLIAVRGYALARAERWSEALEALTEAVMFRPDVPFLDWSLRWLDDVRAMRRLKPEVVASLLTQLSGIARRFHNIPGARQNLDAALALGGRAARVQPAHRELAYARSGLLRTLGETEQAAHALSQLDLEEQASFEYAVEQAALARAEGRANERVGWLVRAQEKKPEQQSTQFELGDAQLELGALRDALRSYERGLALGPSETYGATKDYVRWLLFGESELLRQDVAVVDVHRRRLQEDALGYDQVILDPLDHLVRVIRGALKRAESLPADQRIRLRVQSDLPLSPSAELAFRGGLAALGRVGELEVDYPPARQRLAGIWEKVGGRFVSLHPRPTELLDRRLSECALRAFSWAGFVTAGQELAVLAANPVEFLGIIAHPPGVPAGADAIEWICRVQLLAAFAIVAHVTPWAERDRLLNAMVNSDDWVSVAGVLALAEAAEQDASHASDARRVLGALVPSPGVELPLCARALAIAGSRFRQREEVAPFLELRARALMRSVG
jgi:tetratricopeptide (TPR) repeat protein